MLRDVWLIRDKQPELTDQHHSMAWAPNEILAKLRDGFPTDDWDALNTYFQAELEYHQYGDFYTLHLPGNVNVPAVV